MSSSYYMIQFPFENVSININSTQLTFVIMGLIKLLLLNILFLDWKRVHGFLLGIKSRFVCTTAHAKESNPRAEKIVVHQSLCSKGSDVEVVLKRLGMISDVNKNERNKTTSRKLDSADDIYDMFEEKNPSFDEVREAFDVFDGNRDGFIDSEDLQKVLCALGFIEGLNADNCKRMIVAFDENGDGRIDIDEFVKLMENSCM